MEDSLAGEYVIHPGTRRQHLLQARGPTPAVSTRPVEAGRRRRRGDLRIRPPHRRLPGRPFAPRRLQRGRAFADGLSRDPGAAHDAGHLLAAPQHPGGERPRRDRKDVGGSYGIKVHVYPDEMATAALSVMLRRPVKFVADRLESFLTDIHAREHKATVAARVHQGRRNPRVRSGRPHRDRPVLGVSAHQRHRGQPGGQPHRRPVQHREYRAKMNVVFTNKNVTCQYRAVGHPIAVALTEGIVDLAAEKLGMDPAEFRRRNLIPDDAYPYTVRVGRQVREALAPSVARQAAQADGLREAPCRTGGAAQAGHLSRHRPRRHDRGDQSVAGVLRRRRCAHLGAGRRDAAPRAAGHGVRHVQRDRAGAGHRRRSSRRSPRARSA